MTSFGTKVFDGDDFYLTVTSDNNADIYSDNKVSDFRVQLSHPIFLQHNRWKVGLASFHYPFEFANINATSSVKIHAYGGVHTIVFPPFFCDNVPDLCSYLSEVINFQLNNIVSSCALKERIKDFMTTDMFVSESGIPLSPLTAPNLTSTRWRVKPEFSLQIISFNRIQMKCNIPDFDIGFSDDLLEILGFHTTKQFSLENFETRKVIRNAFIVAMTSFGVTTTYCNQIDKLLDLRENTLKSDFNLSSLHERLSDDSISTWQDLQNELILKMDKTLHEYISIDEPISKQIPNWQEYSGYWTLYVSKTDFDQIVKNSLKHDQDMEDPNDFYYTQGLPFLITATILKQFFKEFISVTEPFVSELKGKIIPSELMYIYSDLVKPEPFNSIMSRILAIVKADGESGKMTSYSPSIIQYKPLDKVDISNFKVLIATDRGVPMPFMRGPAVLTLHFVSL